MARLAVAAATALAFLPVLRNGFVDLDDLENLVANTWIRGLGPANLRWMLTTFHLGHWQPLAWLSCALDYRLWGLDARGFHLTSLLLHAANAGLFAVLAERLLACAGVPAERRLAGAIGAALLWSLHPLRVESVAWATERRDVLAGFFLLLALLAYVQGPGRPPRLGLALLGTVLALTSKASGMVLPALLVLLDVYPLRRLGGAVGWRSRTALRVWLEKLPFVLLAGGAAAVALAAQRAAGALQSLDEITIARRVGAAMLQVGFYLWKTLWPVHLLPLYEYPLDIGPLQRWALAGAATLVALAVVALALRRRCPGLGAALIAYLIALSPTLGLAQSGPQVAADRYTYLALMGFAVLAGGVAATMIASARRYALATLAVTLALGALTWRQCATWHDPRTMWSRVVAIAPDHCYGHKSLGDAARDAGDPDGAVAEYRRAIALRPLPEAHSNLAAVLAAQGRFDEAFEHYRAAIRIKPSYAFAWTSYGVALADAGRGAEAIEAHHRALAINPDLMEAHVNLGSALDAAGQLDEAMREYATAIRLRPTPEAYNNLGTLLVKLGRPADAVQALRQGIALRADIATLHENLGIALQRLDDRAGAAAAFREALRLEPGRASARAALSALSVSAP